MTIAEAITALTAAATTHGLRVVSDDHSRLSASRYLKIAHQDRLGFDAGKSVRRAFCAITRIPFPRDVAFCVRVSDHHGYGDGSVVHHAVRIDGTSADQDIRQAELAISLLAALPHPYHPPHA